MSLMKSILHILLLTILCMVNNYAAASAADDLHPVLMMDGKSKVMSMIHHENSSRGMYTIEIRYPQIRGELLNDAEKHFNRLILSIVGPLSRDFKKNFTLSESRAFKTFHPKSAAYLTTHYSITPFFSKSLHTEILSIRFDVEGNKPGMAHPYHKTITVNSDLGHDRTLVLADLFKPHSNYLPQIADYSMRALQAEKLPADMITVGAAPTLDNYKNWNLSLDGLLITFDEAQVAPRYFGAQSVLIPWEVLKNILNPRYFMHLPNQP